MLQALINRLFGRRTPSAMQPNSAARHSFRPTVESLEDRRLLATFRVVNLNDSGVGSLRQALLDANTNPGGDVIQFRVTGTIRLTSGALPFVTDTVRIDGTTAPGFGGRSRVEVDAAGFAGLRFDTGSGGSSLESLGIVNAAGAGVTLNAGGVRLFGNYIGVARDGRTAAGNRGNGVTINATSTGNTLGGLREQDRNLISGNGGDGITVDGSAGNIIRGNFIGTDAAGKRAIGNAGNGIQLTNGAAANLLGGVIPANPPGTQPPDLSGKKPPLGNVISGNGANGVLLTRGASGNRLNGNFIGTALSGIAAVGNALDGVAILAGSNNNILAGTVQKLDPFIYYNVVSGNRGNGLRIHDSNNTTVQANFFGLGSNNRTPVGNGLSGVVVEGSSDTTTFGGVIPLGNVVSANKQHGIVLKDTASRFTSFNTFGGTTAFTENPVVGNTMDGLHITSTGGRNLIRTSVFSRNGDDGIEVSGAARDVQIVQNIIGLNTSGSNRFGNGDNGVEIGGNAHDILVGGPQPQFSVIPRNIISGNRGYGVAVLGTAHDNRVNFSFIGTDVRGQNAIGNSRGGVLLGPGTRSTAVGSPSTALPTLISGNTGNGIDILGSNGNSVVGTRVGTDRRGDQLPNRGNGVVIQNGFDNQIAGSTIAFNRLNGVFVESGDRNSIRQNSIFENVGVGIALGAGANASQAAPTLLSAIRSGGSVLVSGVAVGRPNTPLAVDLFADRAERRFGAAEGQLYLGTVVVTTDAAGFASFSFTGAVPRHFRVVTATTTDPLGNTSAFSGFVPVRR